MSGPTQGPWAIGLETDNERAQIIAADGSHIAYVECDPVWGNATLIAAAPDLLKALKTIANVPNPSDQWCCTSVKIARDVLAKAGI